MGPDHQGGGGVHRPAVSGAVCQAVAGRPAVAPRRHPAGTGKPTRLQPTSTPWTSSRRFWQPVASSSALAGPHRRLSLSSLGHEPTDQVSGVPPVLGHAIWPGRLSCLRVLELGYVSGVPLVLDRYRAQIRTQWQHGLRSYPWVGHPAGYARSPGRQGSARPGRVASERFLVRAAQVRP